MRTCPTAIAQAVTGRSQHDEGEDAVAGNNHVLVISEQSTLPDNLLKALEILELEMQWCRPEADAIRLAHQRNPVAAVFNLVCAGQLETESVQELTTLLQELTCNTLLLADQIAPSMYSQQGTGNLIGASCHESPEMLKGRLATMIELQPVIRRLEGELRRLHCINAPLNDQFTQVNEEMRVAARLQRDFLPRQIPELPGIRFATIWRPATWVSGDIYDIMRLDETHLGIYIADAVGHGVPAALLTIFIKRALETKRIEGHHYTLIDPGLALAQLNEDIVSQDLSSFQFVTCCYGILDIETLALTVASAGHPMPMRITRTGAAQELDVHGSLLGVFPEQKYTSKTFQLEPGDKLLLYTDGVEAAFVNQGPDQPLRFRQEFGDLARYDLETMCAKLVQTIDEEEGSLHPRDDVTIVGMELAARDPSIPPTAPAAS